MAMVEREYIGPVLFERGYRTFFLGAGIFAGFAIPLWIVVLKTGMEIPTSFSARDYHIHEMIFGYLSAVIAGFLLTALPNWTGRPAIVGWRLALLSALWVCGRIAVITSASWPLAAAIVDASFLLVVAGVAWREVLAGGNIRNVPICLMISLVALANVTYHVVQLDGADMAWVERGALGIITILIALVGGRVIPNFSTNWMKQNDISPLPVPFSLFDKLALLGTLITIVSWIAAPQSELTGYLFSALFVLHVIRMFRWRGWQTFGEPLVFILHVGYMWLPIWFGLTGLAILAPDLFSTSSALHALTAGTIGMMPMAIMTRAILGHSGRKLTANRATQMIYVLIFCGALLRVFAETLPFDYLSVVSASGTLWAGGFILFVFVYGRYCLSEKVTS
ncbi:MAG: NnrS family protein [Rhizobiaceae bacterium]|nr:NnrS family protein [Rhizobiaceae bacterium]